MFNMLDEGNSNEPNKRYFCNYEEEWEEECIRKHDVISEAKLLQKYGGLQWWDPDELKVCTSSKVASKAFEFVKGKGRKPSMYLINAYLENYDTEDEDELKKESMEQWEINEDLRYCICEYYKKHKNVNVVILEEKCASDAKNNDESQSSDSEDE